jgi:hypothetical protein
MAQGFIDPTSDFAHTIRQGAAVEWAQRAIRLAKAAGESLDRESVKQWLDKAEDEDVRNLRTTDPAAHRERYNEAVTATEQLAAF